TSAATAPAEAVAEAATTVLSPLRNERRESLGWCDSLSGRSLMQGVMGDSADERGRSIAGDAFAETTFEDVVLVVINPRQRQLRFADDRPAGDAHRVSRHRRARRVPQRLAATGQSTLFKRPDFHLQSITCGKRNDAVGASEFHRHYARRQSDAREFWIRF